MVSLQNPAGQPMVWPLWPIATALSWLWAILKIAYWARQYPDWIVCGLFTVEASLFYSQFQSWKRIWVPVQVTEVSELDAGQAEALKIKRGNVLNTQNLGGQCIAIGLFSYDFEEKHANFPKNWGGGQLPPPLPLRLRRPCFLCPEQRKIHWYR